MISVLIGVLIIVVVGAICFWAIDKFATDSRLANLLKLLVVLVCLGAIVQSNRLRTSSSDGLSTRFRRGRRYRTAKPSQNSMQTTNALEQKGWRER